MSELVRNWVDIAAVLDVSEDTAQRYAARPFDPLPVFYDHAERPGVWRAALDEWVNRQALHYHSFHALREVRKLPSQRKAEEAAKAPKRASKVSARVRQRA